MNNARMQMSILLLLLPFFATGSEKCTTSQSDPKKTPSLISTAQVDKQPKSASHLLALGCFIQVTEMIPEDSPPKEDVRPYSSEFPSG